MDEARLWPPRSAGLLEGMFVVLSTTLSQRVIVLHKGVGVGGLAWLGNTFVLREAGEARHREAAIYCIVNGV